MSEAPGASSYKAITVRLQRPILLPTSGTYLTTGTWSF